MEFQYLLYEKDEKEKIATVTLNRPERQNAAPIYAEEEFVAAIDDWEKDDNVKVVIIKGAGRSFCAGHDLEAWLQAYGWRDAKGKSPEKHSTQRQRLLYNFNVLGQMSRRLCYSLKPTIAQVHGNCIEWAMTLVVAADMAIAAEDAKFGHLGQTIGGLGIGPLAYYAHLIGPKRAREFLTSGRLISGKEAELWGLVNRAVPVDRLGEEVMKLAKRIALLPIDGIVTGKAYANLVFESMGIFDRLSAGFAHALGQRISFEPDEFDFFKSVREKGLSAAIAERNARYQGL